MTLRQTPRYFMQLICAMLFACLTSGLATAQDAAGDDYGLWYTQGTAAEPGGMLRLSSADDARRLGYIDSCIRPNHQICEDRDAFLVYFGNSPDYSMDRDYTVSLVTEIPNMVITVSTFYDSLHIEDYAEFVGMDTREFGNQIGLDSDCDASFSDLPPVCGNVQTKAIGEILARNERGSNTMTFRPVPGDIGAYLVMISAEDDFATGRYTVGVEPAS